MRIVFMGTPEFAASILTELVQQHEVICVYTRADKPRKRGRALVASPVKDVALAYDINVRTPHVLDAAEIDFLQRLQPEAIVVAAFGKILPQEIIDIPKFGCLNVHASLLPRFRGAAPIERAILAGDAQTGVSIMKMEAGLDTGPYSIVRAIDIVDQDYETLSGELADRGATALLTALEHATHGALKWKTQDESRVTYAAKIARAELSLDPHVSAEINVRRVRASSEAHPARLILAQRAVTALAARVVPDVEIDIEPGEMRYIKRKMLLGCSDGTLEITMLKPDGKRAMTAEAFAAGIQDIKHKTLAWATWSV
ncbi:MAG: methionyl-tRNA formyltransferase [Eggerthellaceae bacterium]|nr:methionyl-tRNA formyltransferase [Eggerthellaceae bacterium]